jgi:hypothetical protein
VNSSFAFAFWGGAFYIFTGDSGNSTVTKYDPSDGSVSFQGTSPGLIVGAGVSTCAPD